MLLRRKTSILTEIPAPYIPSFPKRDRPILDPYLPSLHNETDLFQLMIFVPWVESISYSKRSHTQLFLEGWWSVQKALALLLHSLALMKANPEPKNLVSSAHANQIDMYSGILYHGQISSGMYKLHSSNSSL